MGFMFELCPTWRCPSTVNSQEKTFIKLSSVHNYIAKKCSFYSKTQIVKHYRYKYQTPSYPPPSEQMLTLSLLLFRSYFLSVSTQC